jgi:hypothetical protein
VGESGPLKEPDIGSTVPCSSQTVPIRSRIAPRRSPVRVRLAPLQEVAANCQSRRIFVLVDKRFVLFTFYLIDDPIVAGVDADWIGPC